MPRTPQPLHIFRKDATHLWPETLVVLLLYVALAWSSPSRWTGSDNQIVSLLPLLSILLKAFLLPVSWLVLIVRLIHDEPLVGDRQFWTSRPYHWLSLFAAKVLYLLTFIYLPFLLMQVYLLKHAGLYPTTAIPELLHNLLLLTVIVVIPIAAIAAVTGSMMRALITFVAAIVYLLILFGFLAWAVIRRMPPPQLEPAVIALFIALPLAALLVQYATRRTGIARAMLIATPLAITLLFFAVPADSLVDRAYPPASTPKLTQLPEMLAPKAPPPGKVEVLRGNVAVGIPFLVSGSDPETHTTIEGWAATVDAPGVHWTTPFLGDGTDRIDPSSPVNGLYIAMPLNVYNQVAHAPANVHLTLAVAESKAGKPETWKTGKGSFAVPGHGICAYSAEHPEAAPVCRYPFKTPEMNFARAELSESCPDASGPKVQGFASLGSPVALLDFDPVIVQPLEMRAMGGQPGATYRLCPGTDLIFVEGEKKSTKRLDVELKQVLLEDYARHARELGPRGPRGGGEMEPGPQ